MHSKKAALYFFLLSFLAFLLIVPTGVLAKTDGNKSQRVVEIVCDLSAPQDENSMSYSINGELLSSKPLLEKDDEIFLIARAIKTEEDTKLVIDYKIEGDNPQQALKGFFSDYFSAAAPMDIEERLKGSKIEYISLRKRVEGDLFPGGKITVTFKATNAQDQEINRRDAVINVKDEYPFVFTSSGIAFSNDNNREVIFSDTNETITFVEDGETKQVKRQVLGYNDTNSIKIKPSLIQYLNVRISKWLYGTIGVPVNDKIFSEPFLGFSFYHRNKTIGVVVTAGAQLHQENEIRSDSGYKAGDLINPTEGLTPDKIPTTKKGVARFFLGISFKL